MSKLTDELRTLDCYNPHNFAGAGVVYVVYSPQELGRMNRAARWQVVVPGKKTDPTGHWMNDGHKTFAVMHPVPQNRAAALAEALAWASEKYGVKEWEKTPFNTWMEKGFSKKRISFLRSEAAWERAAAES